MQLLFTLYVAFLFFILTPAILVRLPPKAGKYTVAGFHAIVFGLILHFTGKIVWNFARNLEGFQEGNTTCVNNTNYKKSPLATEFTGAGDQTCITKNTDYCANLTHDNKAKGYYTYDKNKNEKECVVKQSAASTTVSDALKKAVTGFVQQCQNTMKGTSSVLTPAAYNNESTITCTGMAAKEADIINVCKGNSIYDRKKKVCTWTKI